MGPVGQFPRASHRFWRIPRRLSIGTRPQQRVTRKATYGRPKLPRRLAARAAAASGDKAAALATYADLLRVWQQADANLPELREARVYLEQANSKP